MPAAFIRNVLGHLKAQKCRGTIFNIMRYSTQDGPGLRTTVFLKGCPLSCLWCQNPESMSDRQEFVYREVRCLRCGTCVEVCPEQAIQMNGNGHQRREQDCIWCGTCVDACPAEARELVGKDMTAEELLAEIRKDMPFYEESGGGVTFSGGEPLAQPEFLYQSLKLCKGEGIHTAIDTSGAVAWKRFERIAPLTDLFLYDIKCVDDEEHTRLTGVSNSLILDNLRHLSDAGAEIIIRMPVIPGYNDSAEQLDAAAELLVSLGRMHEIVLLPYHAAAADKHAMFNKSFKLAEVRTPTQKHMEHVGQAFATRGIEVTLGGISHE